MDGIRAVMIHTASLSVQKPNTIFQDYYGDITATTASGIKGRVHRKLCQLDEKRAVHLDEFKRSGVVVSRHSSAS